MNSFVKIGGAYVQARSIPENLVNGTATTTQDGKAAVWTWFWKYQIPAGNVIAFKSQRNGKYAFAMTLYEAPTTALADIAQLRLNVYYADNLTFKKTVWIGTYGTIKNGTKYDLEKMVVANEDIDVQPDEYLVWEVYHATETLDTSESKIDIGCTRWVQA